MLRRNQISQALREPLLHFVLLGAALFLIAGIADDETTPIADDRILVTASDAERLALLWQRRWQRPPNPEELQGLIEEHVREEVIYREALALGLDRDDTVIRRHLRRKFEFLTEDLAVSREPDAAEIATYFEANRERYRTPARLSFAQVYFDPIRRGGDGVSQARLVLADLRGGADPAEIEQLGDGTLLESHYLERTEKEVAATFGADFAEALSLLDVGSWTGPIASAYGLHLVRLDARLDAEVLPLAAIEGQVRNDWAYEERQKANAALYEALRARYDVVLEDISSARSQSAR